MAQSSALSGFFPEQIVPVSATRLAANWHDEAGEGARRSLSGWPALPPSASDCGLSERPGWPVQAHRSGRSRQPELQHRLAQRLPGWQLLESLRLLLLARLRR